MGSVSREDRSFRFIEAFNELAKRDYGPSGSMAQEIFKTYGLGFDDRQEMVFMFWSYKDEKQSVDLLVHNGPVFFDPELEDEDTVDRLVEIFEDGGTRRGDIVAMLKKANLIDRDFGKENSSSFESANGLWRLEWINLGEGRNGDYNPENPKDTPLLRADLYRKNEDWPMKSTEKWTALDSGSYCTLAPVGTLHDVLGKISTDLFESLDDSGEGYKRKMELWTRNTDPEKLIEVGKK